MAMLAALVISLTAGAYAKDWQENYEKAAAQAKSEGKFMLLDFSGSDWCGWCIKLDKEVFSKKEFKKYAEENLVLVLVDFPNQKSQSSKLKKQNEALKTKFKITGFPTILILDPDGQFAGRTGYQPDGPEAYVESLKKIIEDYKASKAK